MSGHEAGQVEDRLFIRPTALYLDGDQLTVVTADFDEDAPAQGAIPLYRSEPGTTGGFAGYVSLLPSLDGTMKLLFHGPIPHILAVERCEGCRELLEHEMRFEPPSPH